MKPAAEIETALTSFYGTENYYQHRLSGLVYTDGVKFVAEHCEAYWLIDAIGSFQPACRKDEMLQDMPVEQRGVVAALGRDLLTLARRDQARAAAQPQAAVEPSRDNALQARKELHAMGLKYWDEQQFLEAVRRGDRIAVDLFLAARGLQTKPGG